MDILWCVIGLLLCITDANSTECPETVSLPSLAIYGTGLSIYEKIAAFPCDGHLIGWRTIGAKPEYNIQFGIWIPNYGTHKLLTFLDRINQGSDDNMEPVIIEKGDFMGFVLLKNDSLTVPDFIIPPRKTANTNFKYSNLVAVVPQNTIRGSVISFKEISFKLVPLNFTIHVKMDYSGTYKARWEASRKKSHNKRDKWRSCTSHNLPNCETCRKVKGKVICTFCKDGFFGQTCKKPCPEVCSTCMQESGSCDRCTTGYFGENCKEMCPIRCSPSLGCNADSGCGECQLGFQGMWCEEFVSSCDEGYFPGASCENECPEKCISCNISDSECIVCKKESQWKQCVKAVVGSKDVSEERSSSLGAILGAVFALLTLGVVVTGVAFYIIRRRRSNISRKANVDSETVNGLPSRETLEENARQSNPYIINFSPPSKNQNRQLPLPPNEGEDGYMEPHTLSKPDVTSPLLQEEQHSDTKPVVKLLISESDPSGPESHVEDVYETMGEIEPIEETFE
ncbi:multiple epidermal growth factor-like domains protein 11 [Saccostrea echinata]|uniref:multiple epidermal growth factor-like domains protein 11 n=1 Tax=Saccostrea echinata TaxID=191078 RepID=UPI002A82F9DB|nr:multiple epidermal growth factor-like domains protein 11 [Saccostrea echinata]